MEWYLNLWIVLSTEDKLPFLEQPIPVLPVPPEGQANPPDVLTTHQAWIKAHKEIVGLMLMTMDLDIQKNLEHLGAYDMFKELITLYVQQTDQEVLQTVREFHACKQEEGQSVSSCFLKMKIYIDNLERLGHVMTQNLSVNLILVSLRKEYDGFVQNYNMHSMGKTINELHAMLKLNEQTLPPKEVAPALHAIRAGRIQKNQKRKSHKAAKGNQGKGKAKMGYAPGSRKMKLGALSLYVGDGHRATFEAIGDYHLCLPSGIVLILHNCHYAPLITRGVISVSRLYKDGFVNHFENDNLISVFKNNMIYFNVIPRDDIYEIVMSSFNANKSSIHVVTNKSAKLNLDSALLWHCLLGHINKKRIEKLQHDGLLDSTDIKSFEKCVACMSGNMDHMIIAHRTPPYTPQHNGVSERRNRTLLDMVRSIMSQTTLPKSFWDYAIESAARILSMVPTKKFDKTPYEVWHGQAPKLSYLKNKIFVAKNDEFLENSLINHEASESLEDLEIIQEEDMHPSLNTSLNHEENDQEIDEPQSDINLIYMSTKTRYPIDRLCLYVDAEKHGLGDLSEPANYKAALLDPKSDKWHNAMNVEMQSMKDNKRMQNIPYAWAVGSIMYAVRCTRPDVAFAQNIISQFQQNPGDAYRTAVKNIQKYLRNTKDMFLVYEEAVWIRKFIFGIGVVPIIEESINMYCDNTRAIVIAKDHGFTKGARHFHTKIHYLRETIEMCDVRIEKVDTDDNLADPFTKALAFPKHSELTEKIGMIPASSLIKIPWALLGINQIIAWPCPKAHYNVSTQNMYQHNLDEIAGLYKAWLQHGQIPWKTLFQPAISLAKDRIIVAPYLANSLATYAARIKKDSRLQKVSYSKRSVGGILTMEYLRKYEVKVTDIVEMNTMGFTILGCHPSQALNILNSYENTNDPRNRAFRCCSISKSIPQVDAKSGILRNWTVIDGGHIELSDDRTKFLIGIGLSKCKASESNIRRIRVKDIVKKVEVYLKTYSSAGMNINLRETQYLLKARQKDSNSDVEEDQRTSNEFMIDLNAEYHERALLANQNRFYKRSGRLGQLGTNSKKHVLLMGNLMMKGAPKIRAFMAIAEDEPSVGKADARSGQWVDITMKKVHRLLSMIDDQLLSEIVHGNIVKALGRKGKRKEKISSKEVVFTKADEFSYVLAPEITFDSESECDSHEPLPPLPKLIGAAPSGTSESLISLSDLTLNMADLTLGTPVPKKNRPSVKVSPAYVIKKETKKSPAGPKPCFDKKSDSSTEQLLLTQMEELKGLKRKIEIPSDTPSSSS
uniref:Zinc finger, CCHC-type n=1 Tax=Tanacetum cinerariifolium TaxID=118510 RepID=A0A699GVE9_TANCI|nr:zinc finger, CCHC-type [Tanacetum cinerariifolium]